MSRTYYMGVMHQFCHRGVTRISGLPPFVLALAHKRTDAVFGKGRMECSERDACLERDGCRGWEGTDVVFGKGRMPCLERDGCRAWKGTDWGRMSCLERDGCRLRKGTRMPCLERDGCRVWKGTDVVLWTTLGGGKVLMSCVRRRRPSGPMRSTCPTRSHPVPPGLHPAVPSELQPPGHSCRISTYR